MKRLHLFSLLGMGLLAYQSIRTRYRSTRSDRRKVGESRTERRERIVGDVLRRSRLEGRLRDDGVHMGDGEARRSLWAA